MSRIEHSPGERTGHQATAGWLQTQAARALGQAAAVRPRAALAGEGLHAWPARWTPEPEADPTSAHAPGLHAPAGIRPPQLRHPERQAMWRPLLPLQPPPGLAAPFSGQSPSTVEPAAAAATDRPRPASTGADAHTHALATNRQAPDGHGQPHPAASGSRQPAAAPAPQSAGPAQPGAASAAHADADADRPAMAAVPEALLPRLATRPDALGEHALAAHRPSPARNPNAATAATAPAVHVHIGRVELTVEPPATSRPARRRAASAGSSLSDYLRQPPSAG